MTDTMMWPEIKARFDQLSVFMPPNASQHANCTDASQTTLFRTQSAFHQHRFPSLIVLDQAGVTQKMEQSLREYLSPGLDRAEMARVSLAARELLQRRVIPLLGEAGVQACIEASFVQPVNMITLDQDATRNQPYPLHLGLARYFQVNGMKSSDPNEAAVIPDMLGKSGIRRTGDGETADTTIMTAEFKAPTVLQAANNPMMNNLFEGVPITDNGALGPLLDPTPTGRRCLSQARPAHGSARQLHH